MNGMNLSGKPGIVQPMQMPPDVRAAADAVDPAPLGHVAVHDRAPAARASRCTSASRTRSRSRPARSSRPGRSPRAPWRRTATAAAAPRRAGSSGPARWPGRAGRGCLGEVVAVDRAAGHAHDRDAGLRLPVPARGSRARPWRRWGCRPWRACRRRWRRCRRPARPAPSGVRRSSHSLVVIGWSVSGLLPNPHQ